MPTIHDSSPVFTNSKFICPRTKQEFTYQMIRGTWTCSCCNLPINIYAILSKNQHFLIKRIKASELKIGDHFIIPGYEDGNEILNINFEDDIVFIAMKGYGHMHWKSTALVNILNGTWNE